LHLKQYKLSRNSLSAQLHLIPATDLQASLNPFVILIDQTDKDEEDSSTMALPEKKDTQPIMTQPDPQPVSQKWSIDTNVSCFSSTILQQLHLDQQPLQEAEGSNPDSLQYEPHMAALSLPMSSNQCIRFNLICHWNTMSDIKMAQLFKSFASTLREIDQHISILPYSLSSYFHISSSYSFESIKASPKILEWLEYNKYSMRLEMMQIGALCFSSIFMYQEDLKASIVQLPLWTTQFLMNPPVFDIYPADFTGPSRRLK
jgi:hypothetical protein